MERPWTTASTGEVFDADHSSVCMVIQRTGWRERQRLIAAAPDLYEALVDAEARLRGAGMIGAGVGHNPDPVILALKRAQEGDRDG